MPSKASADVVHREHPARVVLVQVSGSVHRVLQAREHRVSAQREHLVSARREVPVSGLAAWVAQALRTWPGCLAGLSKRC